MKRTKYPPPPKKKKLCNEQNSTKTYEIQKKSVKRNQIKYKSTKKVPNTKYPPQTAVPHPKGAGRRHLEESPLNDHNI